MSDNKQEYIAKLEKAISQKYGDEAINNPQRFWDEDKEKEYISRISSMLVGCYIQYVEGREERWSTGWRPNKEK